MSPIAPNTIAVAAEGREVVEGALPAFDTGTETLSAGFDVAFSLLSQRPLRRPIRTRPLEDSLASGSRRVAINTPSNEELIRWAKEANLDDGWAEDSGDPTEPTPRT